ncbi:MAG: CPBP family glutamic-type intramembrane protease [Candidatus Acidiferrales bacterium]
MTPAVKRALALVDVAGLPIFILVFIWRLQFTTNWVWVGFVVWMLASFAIHRDTPKTLGWRADNLWPATRRAAAAFAILASALIVTGVVLRAPGQVPAHLIKLDRLWSYFAFCVLQQVALNSLLMNRMSFLISRRWLAAALTGVIFAACHWPNPVLVPLTFIGGTVMAWLFASERNIIPLAIMQALLGTLAWWAFPLAWHHHLRVGPGYFHG